MSKDASKAVNAKADVAQRWGGRVPIVIGATGHREFKPEASEKLIAALKKECGELRKHYRSSPFVVLSGLAEGADRMIAKAAMKELGADLIAVLPMPEADYERDFGTEESKTEFRELLDQALYVRTAPAPGGDPTWKVDGEPRNAQYARAGAIIADYSHILFAIWDGLPARGTGGTANQVEWFERGYSPSEYSLHKHALSPLSTPEPGLKIQLNPINAQISVIEHPQARERNGYMQSILSKTDKYNRDVLCNRDFARSDDAFPAGAAGKDFEIAGTAYSKADGLSIYFSKQFHKFELAIYYFAMISIVSVNFIGESHYTTWLYFGLSLAIAILSARVWLGSARTRSMEDRCLAEAMRTLFFWRMAGVARPVWLAYRSRRPGLVHWISYAVRALEFCQDCRVQMQPKEGGTDAVHLAKLHWVDDQKAWFLRREAKHLRRFTLLKWTARFAIAASLATAGVAAVLTFAPNEGLLWEGWVKPYGSYWQVALGLFAAIEISARDKSLHLDLANRYASQRQIFETASRMLGTMLPDPQLQGAAAKILEELGEIVLQEQEEWLWLTHGRTSTQPA